MDRRFGDERASPQVRTAPRRPARPAWQEARSDPRAERLRMGSPQPRSQAVEYGAYADAAGGPDYYPRPVARHPAGGHTSGQHMQPRSRFAFGSSTSRSTSYWMSPTFDARASANAGAAVERDPFAAPSPVPRRNSLRGQQRPPSPSPQRTQAAPARQPARPASDESGAPLDTWQQQQQQREQAEALEYRRFLEGQTSSTGVVFSFE